MKAFQKKNENDKCQFFVIKYNTITDNSFNFVIYSYISIDLFAPEKYDE